MLYGLSVAVCVLIPITGCATLPGSNHLVNTNAPFHSILEPFGDGFNLRSLNENGVGFSVGDSRSATNSLIGGIDWSQDRIENTFVLNVETGLGLSAKLETGGVPKTFGDFNFQDQITFQNGSTEKTSAVAAGTSVNWSADNKTSGIIVIQSGASNFYMTNSTVGTNSLVVCTVMDDDASAISVAAINQASNVIRFKLNAAATANCRVGWKIIGVAN